MTQLTKEELADFPLEAREVHITDDGKTCLVTVSTLFELRSHIAWWGNIYTFDEGVPDLDPSTGRIAIDLYYKKR